MYYLKPRTEVHKGGEEPTPPSNEELESLDRPPADFVHAMTDYNYTSFVGDVCFYRIFNFS